jgi:hypothetical protein
MQTIVKRMRKWLEAKIIGSVMSSIKGGFWTIERDTKGGSSFVFMSLKSDGSLFKIFPVMSTVKLKSVPISTVLSPVVSSIQDTSIAQLQLVPGTITGSAESAMKVRINAGIGTANAASAKAAAKLAARFDESYLRNLVKRDRNDFRKKLLEATAKQASEAFGKIARKHLASLILRIRQEALGDTVSSSDDKAAPVALPTGTRFFVRKGTMTVFIIEQQPQIRSIKIMDQNGSRSQIYPLSMPYIVFMVVMRGRKSDGMYAFFRKKPLRSMKDELLNPSLPNILKGNRLCFTPSATKDSLAETAEESIANYWGGRFIKTHDPESFVSIDFDEWVEKTAGNPLYGLTRAWDSAGSSPESMIETIQEDFAIESDPQRKSADGTKMMSALDAVINSIVDSAANEMKEVCFGMVSDWKIEEAAIATVIDQFKETIAGVGHEIKDLLAGEVSNVLSEETLKSALERAITNATATINGDIQKHTEVVVKAIINQAKEGGSQ